MTADDLHSFARGLLIQESPDQDPEHIERAIDRYDLGQFFPKKEDSPRAKSPAKAKSPPKAKAKSPPKAKAKKPAMNHEEKVQKAKEKAILPFDPDKCHARVWGTMGYGCQCTSIPVPGTTFCKKVAHGTDDWQFGRFDAEKPKGHAWKDPNSDEIPKEKGTRKAKAPKKAPKEKKEKKDNKEVTPEVKEAKERYESLHGKKPRGPKAGDLAWLEKKNAEKAEADGEGEKAVPDAPDVHDVPDVVEEVDIAEEKAKLVSDKLKEIEDELDPELEEDQCIEDWEYQGVQYLLDMVTNQVFDENNDLVGVRNEAGEIDFATEEASNRHSQACDEEDEPESDEEAEDGEA